MSAHKAISSIIGSLQPKVLITSTSQTACLRSSLQDFLPIVIFPIHMVLQPQPDLHQSIEPMYYIHSPIIWPILRYLTKGLGVKMILTSTFASFLSLVKHIDRISFQCCISSTSIAPSYRGLKYLVFASHCKHRRSPFPAPFLQAKLPFLKNLHYLVP